MDKANKDGRKPQTDRLRGRERDDRGTKIERTPGPGPKDEGKGAMGKEAKDRLDRNH